MWIMKRYNGKVLTVNGFYALKCIGTHLYHPIGPDTTTGKNGNSGISVIPTSPEQGIIQLFLVSLQSYPKNVIQLGS